MKVLLYSGKTPLSLLPELDLVSSTMHMKVGLLEFCAAVNFLIPLRGAAEQL